VAIENGGCGLSVRLETCVGLELDMVLTMVSGIRVGDGTRWVGLVIRIGWRMDS
jgi:hypothetical protein